MSFLQKDTVTECHFYRMTLSKNVIFTEWHSHRMSLSLKMTLSQNVTLTKFHCHKITLSQMDTVEKWHFNKMTPSQNDIDTWWNFQLSFSATVTKRPCHIMTPWQNVHCHRMTPSQDYFVTKLQCHRITLSQNNDCHEMALSHTERRPNWEKSQNKKKISLNDEFTLRGGHEMKKITQSRRHNVEW